MTYIVQPGDTLYAIAQTYNTTVDVLVSLNNLSNPSSIFPGQLLIVPKIDLDYFDYVVVSGDTLYAIATKFSVSVTELVYYNNLVEPYTIYDGQTLLIPGTPPAPAQGSFVYIVQLGDSVSSIARNTNTTPDGILKLNSLPDPDIIYPGQRLIIPSSQPTLN
jgi:LysM repeat protein